MTKVLLWPNVTEESVRALSYPELIASRDWAVHCYDILTWGCDQLSSTQYEHVQRMHEALNILTSEIELRKKCSAPHQAQGDAYDPAALSRA